MNVNRFVRLGWPPLGAATVPRLGIMCYSLVCGTGRSVEMSFGPYNGRNLGGATAELAEYNGGADKSLIRLGLARGALVLVLGRLASMCTAAYNWEPNRTNFLTEPPKSVQKYSFTLDLRAESKLSSHFVFTLLKRRKYNTSDGDTSKMISG